MSKLLSLTTCLPHRDKGILLRALSNNTTSQIFGFFFVRSLSCWAPGRKQWILFLMSSGWLDVGIGSRSINYKADARAVLSPCWLVLKIKRFQETCPYIFTGYHAFEPPLPLPNKIRYCDSYKQSYIFATNLIPVNFKIDKVQVENDKFWLFLKMFFWCENEHPFTVRIRWWY